MHPIVCSRVYRSRFVFSFVFFFSVHSTWCFAFVALPRGRRFLPHTALPAKAGTQNRLPTCYSAVRRFVCCKTRVSNSLGEQRWTRRSGMMTAKTATPGSFWKSVKGRTQHTECVRVNVICRLSVAERNRTSLWRLRVHRGRFTARLVPDRLVSRYRRRIQARESDENREFISSVALEDGRCSLAAFSRPVTRASATAAPSSAACAKGLPPSFGCFDLVLLAAPAGGIHSSALQQPSCQVPPEQELDCGGGPLRRPPPCGRGWEGTAVSRRVV